MKDFPMFTTEDGVASLTLSEVPYTSTAYIRIQDSCQPLELLEECISFCKVAGADKILATGDPCLEKYPLFSSVIQMQAQNNQLPDTDAALFPVQEKTLEKWRVIYNERMINVPNAAYLSQTKAKELFKSLNLYFVHRGEQLLGIGAISGSKIETLASVIPGAGQDLVCALSSGIFNDAVSLEVALENTKAVNLYRNLGFLPVKEISKWYRVK